MRESNKVIRAQESPITPFDNIKCIAMIPIPEWLLYFGRIPISYYNSLPDKPNSNYPFEASKEGVINFLNNYFNERESEKITNGDFTNFSKKAGFKAEIISRKRESGEVLEKVYNLGTFKYQEVNDSYFIWSWTINGWDNFQQNLNDKNNIKGIANSKDNLINLISDASNSTEAMNLQCRITFDVYSMVNETGQNVIKNEEVRVSSNSKRLSLCFPLWNSNVWANTHSIVSGGKDFLDNMILGARFYQEFKNKAPFNFTSNSISVADKFSIAVDLRKHNNDSIFLVNSQDGINRKIDDILNSLKNNNANQNNVFCPTPKLYLIYINGNNGNTGNRNIEGVFTKINDADSSIIASIGMFDDISKMFRGFFHGLGHYFGLSDEY